MKILTKTIYNLPGIPLTLADHQALPGGKYSDGVGVTVEPYTEAI